MFLNLKLIRKLVLFLAVAVFFGLVGYQLGTHEVKLSWEATRKIPPTVISSSKLAPKQFQDSVDLFWRVWDEVNTKYVDKSKVDNQKMLMGSITGMVSAIGDPYTLFLPPKENQEIKDDLNGSFEGIGAQLGMKDNRVIIATPLVGSPAEKVGLRSGDWILKVDGQTTDNWSIPQAVAKIRGTKGTKVTLNIFRENNGVPFDVTIIRDTIILKSVDWKIVDGAVVLSLNRFGDQTFPQWDQSVLEIGSYLATSSAKVSGIVLDLRNNPGGYLQGAVYVASEFLRSGVIVKQVDYAGTTQTFSVNREGKLLSIPLVVLVNAGTASAGEILGGALQTVNRAKIVGEKSFGKGSVQETRDFENGAGLHVTTSKWLLSNDVWINGKGLTPDVKIENDESKPDQDLQLKKAIEVLRNF